MQRIEVSHKIEMGMKTYPGLPEPRAEVLIDYDSGRYGGLSEFYIASLHCCGNTGTYVDAPIHRYRGGTDLAGLSLERLAHVPLLVVDALDVLSIGPDRFRGLKMAGRAVVVRTEWSRHWRTDAYFGENPHLTQEACQALLDGGALFAGIDSVNIDALPDLRRPAHTTLLAAGVPICEHMTNLSALPKEGGYIHAAPIAWVGGATFPVRAYVLVD
jgi:kynurenine formamidase